MRLSNSKQLSINRLIDLSINQSINQSINLSIYQSVNQSINQSVMFLGCSQYSKQWLKHGLHYKMSSSMIILLIISLGIPCSLRGTFHMCFSHRISWEIRRVAVYLETHCNIDSKKAFPTGVLDRWHNCLLICWRNVAQLPRPHRFVYLLRHDSARRPRWPLTIAENLGRYLSGTQRTAQRKTLIWF